MLDGRGVFVWRRRNLRMCSPLLGLRPMRRAPACDLAWAAIRLPPTSSFALEVVPAAVEQLRELFADLP